MASHWDCQDSTARPICAHFLFPLILHSWSLDSYQQQLAAQQRRKPWYSSVLAGDQLLVIAQPLGPVLLSPTVLQPVLSKTVNWDTRWLVRWPMAKCQQIDQQLNKHGLCQGWLIIIDHHCSLLLLTYFNCVLIMIPSVVYYCGFLD